MNAMLCDSAFVMNGQVHVKGGVRHVFAGSGSPLRVPGVGLGAHVEPPAHRASGRHALRVRLREIRDGEAGVPLPLAWRARPGTSRLEPMPALEYRLEYRSGGPGEPAAGGNRVRAPTPAGCFSRTSASCRSDLAPNPSSRFCRTSGCCYGAAASVLCAARPAIPRPSANYYSGGSPRPQRPESPRAARGSGDPPALHSPRTRSGATPPGSPAVRVFAEGGVCTRIACRPVRPRGSTAGLSPLTASTSRGLLPLDRCKGTGSMRNE